MMQGVYRFFEVYVLIYISSHITKIMLTTCGCHCRLWSPSYLFQEESLMAATE